KCKDKGVTFGYHNHDFEFKTYHGKTGLELLFENTEPELVKMELDCYWATFAGYNPEEIIKKYANRMISLHLKDMKKENNQMRSIEISSGILDISRLIHIGKETGIPWFIVEQEDFDMDPMKSAKKNIKALHRLLDA